MILDEEFPPDPRVYNEAATLLRHGNSIELLCLDYGTKKPKQEFIDGIHVKRIRVPKFIRSLNALAYSNPLYHLVMTFLLRRTVKKDIKYDAIHIHDMRIARAVFWVFKDHQRIILDLHENRPEIMKYYRHVNNKLGRILIKPATWKRFEKKLISKADKAIVVTRSAAEYYQKIFAVRPDKFVVVPNSVQKSFVTDYSIDTTIIKAYENKRVLLYIGDTGERRGVGDVLEAMQMLVNLYPDLYFVCVGSSSDDEKWRKKADLLKLDKYVDFTGWQDVALLPSYLISSSFCISPLHKNIHHDTTYANKLFQYMAFGKPVIVSICTAQHRVIEDEQCGLIFKARDITQLAESIRFLLDNPEEAAKMGKRAKLALERKYIWEEVSKDLINLYSN